VLARKKTFSKTDKKKLKEYKAWVAVEEAALSERHEKELAEFEASVSTQNF
jgi:hypothetical protein